MVFFWLIKKLVKFVVWIKILFNVEFVLGIGNLVVVVERKLFIIIVVLFGYYL